MKTSGNIARKYLLPTKFVDSDHPSIIELANKLIDKNDSNIEKAVKLYYYVRDTIRYNPYKINLSEQSLKASDVLKRKYGYCVEKANLLAALGRALGIPSRFGFADVKNHLSSPKLIEMLRSEVFAFHGYTELYLDSKWVKATPAFNKELCELMHVSPLEFNGREDSIFHEFDADGKIFMHYLKDHGIFHDIPRDYMIETLASHYPHLFEEGNLLISGNDSEDYFFKI